MNSKLLFALSFIAINSAHAQVWDSVVESNTGAVYFINKDSIRPSGDFTACTQLSNYSNGFTYNNRLVRSMVQSRLTDCVANKFKTIGAIGYSELDAKGDIVLVSTKSDSDWILINMTKITSDIQKEVCK
jgi:hypothetical protein